LVVADLPAREYVGKSLVGHEGGLAEDEEGEVDAEIKGEKGAHGEEMDGGRKKGADGRKSGEKNGEEVEKKKPPPTQFNEPDANSLLDAFGF
jgi:hypothetical protein